MSTTDDTGEVESNASDDASRSEEVILTPEDRQRITEAVKDVIPRKRLRRSDTGRTSSCEATLCSMSPSSATNVQQGDDQAVSVGKEAEVPIKSTGGIETREEHHVRVTVGGTRLSVTPDHDRSGSIRQPQIHGGDTQTLATADKSSVINIQELHLHQTNVKNENCSVVSVGGNVTVNSGTEQETLAPQAQGQLTQAQEELKAMRESTSEKLREWTTDMVHTEAVDVLVEQLSNGPSVYVLKGQPGEGKTTVAKMALKKLQDKGREVFVVTQPAEYFTVKPFKESIILLNDIFGSSHFHLDNLSRWENVFDDHLALQEHNETAHAISKPTFLLVSRSSVLDAAAKHFRRFRSLILKEDCTMDLTNDMKYTVEEKVKIWSYYACRHRVDIEERIMRKVCSLFLPYGFPHCCRLFAKMCSNNQQLKMEKFFLQPLEFLQQELESVFEEDIAGMVLRKMLKSEGKLTLDSLFESEEKLFHVQKTIGKYQGLYFRREGNVVSFHHPSIYDTVAFIACKVVPLFVVQNCNMTFLNDRVRLADISGPETEQQQTVEIDSSYKQQFMDRLGNEITKGNISDVLSHASFHYDNFVRDFMEKIVSASIWHTTKTAVLHDIIHMKDKKTRHTFLFLCSKNKSNKILKYICKRVVLTPKDQRAVLFGICNQRSEAALQYFFETFPRCDLSVRNERGQTLLMVAARNPCDSILKTLIDRGISVYAKDLWGHTALEYICEYGVERDPGIVEIMMKKGADINECIKTPLVTACYAGHSKLIAPLLQMGADINATCSSQQTPLTASCEQGFNTVVAILLDKGADINQPDGWGETPLTVACRYGHNTVVTILLDRSANINTSSERGQTPLAVACERGHHAVITTLLDKGSEGNIPGGWREAPLIAACRAGQNAKVIAQLDRGGDIDRPVGGGQTPLTAACTFGHNTVVITLLEKGADINDLDGLGETPLIAACRRGHNTVVTTLLDRGADIYKHGRSGKTPLTTACGMGYNTLVSILLDKGADGNVLDGLGDKPLIIVCKVGNDMLVTTLLDNGADIDDHDGLGRTPLTAACRNGHNTVVTTLLGKGADINKPSRKGETPLTGACRQGRNTVVNTLLDKGADRNTPDGQGETPLTAACSWGCNTVALTLLYRGADSNTPDGNVETPLTVACSWGHNTVVITLLDKGADINQPDGDGETPLNVACRCGKNTVVTTLLDRGADINQPDGDGETPVFAACRFDRNTVVTTLLERGADVNNPNRKGETPLSIARGHRYDTITTLLDRKGKK